MNSKLLLARALKKEFLSTEEGMFLYNTVPTAELMWTANELRQDTVPGNIVTWQIDRNVNTTNACNANCKFCNFFRHPKHKDVYITDINTKTIEVLLTISNPKSFIRKTYKIRKTEKILRFIKRKNNLYKI